MPVMDFSFQGYFDLPEDSVSAVIETYQRSSAWAARDRGPPTDAMRIGSAWHCLVLEGAEAYASRHEFITACMTPKKNKVPCEHPGIKEGGVCGVHGRGRADIEDGITPDQDILIRMMASATLMSPHWVTPDAVEQTWVSNGRKGRPDALFKSAGVILDLKSGGWHQRFNSLRYIRIRAAWYLDLAESLGLPYHTYRIGYCPRDEVPELFVQDVTEDEVADGRRIIEEVLAGEQRPPRLWNTNIQVSKEMASAWDTVPIEEGYE